MILHYSLPFWRIMIMHYHYFYSVMHNVWLGSTISRASYLWECTTKFPPFPLPHVWKKYFWHWKTLLFWSKGSMELLTNLIVVTIFFIEKKSFYPPGASNQSVLFSLLRTTFFLEFKLCQGLSIFRRMRFEPKKLIAKKHIQAKLMLIFLLRETCY